MKKFNITTDLIIGIGLCIALIIALVKGVSAEIVTCIVGNLGGYMGRSIISEHIANNSPLPQNTTPKIISLEKGVGNNDKS